MFKNTFSRVISAAVSGVLVFATLSVVAPAAQAQAAEGSTVPPMIDNPANGVVADALPTAQIDGIALDQVIVGDTVFVGGKFANARPAGSAAGTNQVTRSNLMSYTLSTGVMTSWAPVVNGEIRVLALSPDKSRLYIGGSFSTVNGFTRNHIAAFNTSDGSLVTNFAPNVSSDVFGIAVGNSAVYMGGWFTAINSIARTRLGAVTLTGTTTAWAPTADFTVQSVGLTDAQDRVVVAGGFSQINGVSAPSFAGIDAVTGNLYSFAANQLINNSGVNAPAGSGYGAGVTSIKMENGSAYATGWSWYMGNFEGVVKVDPYTGAIQNMMECRGDTYDSVVMNGLIYAVSHHHHCDQIGGFPEQTPTRWLQYGDAMTDNVTGQVQSYFPGQPAGSYVNWFPRFTVGSVQGQAGWSVEASGNYLAVGGEFTQVNDTLQQGLVRFGTRSVVAKPAVGPAAAKASVVTSLRNISPTSTRVSFPSQWDRDGEQLSYKIFRADKGTKTPVQTLTGTSQFWNRPILTWIDTGLTTGATYTYTVTAVDADGNTKSADAVSIVAGTNVPPASAYSNQVFADGASNYWRMDDAVGATTAVDWAGSNDLVLASSGITMGQAGADNGSTDTAALFSGADGVSGGSSTSLPGPNTFSQELWFKTGTTTGGKLLGFGSAQSGGSGSYDRHIYMTGDGRLSFGVYPGTSKIVSSAKSYNDNQWHHAVSTLSSAGMALWVDGMKVGEDASVTYGQDYTGYWRVGGDTSWAGDNYFDGTIDDVAIYPTALTKAQIRDHFTKSGRTLNLPTPPSDAYGASVVADEPTLYWRLDENGSTTAVDANGNANNGTYYNGVTQGVASTVVAGDAAARFDGADDVVSSNASFANPTVFSTEAWFNTTSTSGGKIIGFGSSPNGGSAHYDRHIYMTPDGRLNFGTYNGNLNVATSPLPYNDGSWHQVVGTLGSNGMQLFVDGQLVATNANTVPEGYDGYWRVGGDNTWAGNAYFAGAIDEVAVYPTVLSAARVLAHYKASGAWHNAVPVVSIDGTCTTLGACNLSASATDPDGTIAGLLWDFGDGTTSTEATVSHTYTTAGVKTITLTATDDLGATTTATKTVTVKTAQPVPTDPYGQLVSTDTPSIYWRMGEASGNTAYDYSRQVHDGSYANGFTLGQDSQVVSGDKAAALSGDGWVASQDQFANPTTFSIEAWFNTTSAGARIIGFGNQKDQRSNNYDRHIYLDSDGHLVFGIWNGGSYTITTPGTYNNGAWHHVVGTLSPAGGMAFYVDGALVGTNEHNSVDAYDGYWRVGADNIWSGSGQVNGLVDEAAVYDHVLSAATVKAHYRASGVFVNQQPVASFSVTKAGLTIGADGTASSDPDGTIASYAWDFGDGGSSSLAAPNHTFADEGTYTVSLTVKDDLGVANTTTRTVTVRPGPAAPTDDYGQSVSADNPLLFWRLDEQSGNTAHDATVHTYDGTSQGASLGASSPVTSVGRSASFVGNQFIASNEPFVNPTTFSVEAWFRTGQAGQRIIGFGNNNDQRSSNYDRHVFLDNDGHLVFGTYADGFHTVTTSGTYADNAWHQVVGTFGASGMALYVDGVLQGTDSNTAAQNYTGYWRVGADNAWSGASGDFNGQIDEAAVYGSVLGSDRVAAHYAAALASNQAPVADFTTECTAASCSLTATATDHDGSIAGYEWDFGDSTPAVSGPDVATTSHVYGAAGTYPVTLTVTDNRGTKTVVSHDVEIVIPNQPPTPLIGTPTVDGLTVGVDGSGSTDPEHDTLAYTWDFGDATATATGATATHQYLVEGIYTVTLTVDDGHGNVRSTTTEVTVAPPNEPPHAVISSATVTGLTVAVDGSTSFDPEAKPLTYAWSFGDGATATTPTASHTYTGGGSFTITLVVTDVKGVQATATTSVTVVAPNQAPTARIGTPVTDGLGVTVDGSGSSDPEHTALTYAWTFDDGATATGVSASHTFTTEGQHTITLVVTDAGGASNSTSVTVTLVKPNQKPVAVIGTPQVSGLNVQVDGTGSHDDGSIKSYAWSFGDGGTADTAIAAHTYTVGGTYDVKLVVTDNLDVTSEIASASVTVTAPNQAPVPHIGTPAIDGLKVTVSGSGSTDDGSIASYTWNFGEGADVSSSDPGATHTYSGTGTFTITLTVTDNIGVSASTTTQVSVVKPNEKPTAVIADPVVDLNSVTVNGSGSTDDGTIVGYAWNFGDGGTASGASATHAYTAGGTYTVTLTVTDNVGATDSATKSVTVSAPAVTSLAKDTFNRTGSRWGTADIGGAWTDSGASYFATDGSLGQVTISRAGSGPSASLAAVSARDVTLVTDFALAARPTGASFYEQANVRLVGTSSYMFSVRVDTNGALLLDVSRVVSGTSTSLKSVTLSTFGYTAGERLRLRFDANGNGTTSLAGKVWRIGDAEPATAQVTTTDSTSVLQAAGAVSLKYYTGSGTTSLPTKVSVDNFELTPYTTGGLANQAPVARFDATTKTWKLSVDASASTDDGTIASYAWDFGDGTTGTGKTATHTYTADNTYSVKLTVTDDRGVSTSLTKQVTVANSAPVAGFSATPTERTVAVDASASTDDGTIASYAWDFGDGSTGTGKTATHTYTADNTFQVKLTVTDDVGSSTLFTRSVTVVNAAPTAKFTTKTTDLELDVDASTSTDDAGISSYAWDFGDGTGTGATASHTYATAGTYAVTLTVTDAHGLTGTLTKSVTVAVNAAPVASFTATPTDLKVAVDASASHDTDGSIASYAWDFGDGGSATDAVTSHTYGSAGTYTVKLTVTDDKGKTDTASKSVIVSAPVSDVLASDTFSRTVASGWGSADTGGAWTVSSASMYSVNGSRGLVTIPTAGKGPVARLGSLSARDVSIVTDFALDKVPAGGSYYHQVIARTDSGVSSFYMLSVRLETTGALVLDINKSVSGTSTTLKTVRITGFNYAAGDRVKVRFDVTGNGTTTLSGKAWRSTDTEPTTAQITTTDTTASLQSAGSVAIKTYLGSAMTSVPLVVSVSGVKVQKA